MEQRLIDANALKKEVGSTFHGAIGLTVTGAVHEIIDRQPTIDPESLRPSGRCSMKPIVDRIGKPAMLEQTAEECAELAHACLKEARRLRGENPTPKTTPECWLAISEELTDLQICIEMLEAAGYHGDPDIADVKRQRMVQRLDEAGK